MRRALVLLFAVLGLLALPALPSATAAGATVGVAPAATGSWTVDAAGVVTPVGGAPNLGSAPAGLRSPVVGMTATPTGRGYWLVAADGGIFTFGDAAFRGSTGALRLARPIVGITATPTGRGYWLVASDGGIFTFGDAVFRGSTGALRLTRPIVGMAATATGRGYWLVASDGGIFTFGDAVFRGSAGALALASPIVGMARTATGNGYWLVGADGGVFSFGDATYAGRADGGVRAVTAAGGGYRIASVDGSVTAFVAGAAPTTAMPKASRDAWRWPFASTSPWNVPVGSGARFETASAPRTSNLNDLRARSWVNAGSYSAPIYRATSTDPLATVSDDGRISQYRIPLGAQPSTGTDGALFIVDPSGRWVDETWRMSGGPLAWTTSYHVRNDLHGSGWGSGGVRAAAGSGIGGIIRHWEIDAGVIRHGLALSIADFQLQRGPVWPATAEDANASVYHGLNPMGTFAAIPPAVDVASLGLTREGAIVARALQDYGAYVVDRNGESFVLKAEPSLDDTVALTNMRRDLAKIRPHLRVVTNNGPSSINGGGTPRRPLAPPL
ncbi:MAG TPA: hypothetical protein VFU93_07580 [Acidimicrobiales bacterium]|nr:hypothetical protein [Acidimicrobiales bacterium]